ncbi:MAG: undecaprenyl-diphosphate phosphatase [Gammaproteobacteria bacterium]|nr:undecaprenyl-diphosphate phosphatase [Gammaproteobacteria bacterium]
MDLIHFIILGIVQGITEFLPISSSAHLILAPHVFGWEDQGLHHDVAAHVGTLAAVCWFLRQEVRAVLIGLMPGRGEAAAHGRRMLGFLVVGTLPVVASGLLLRDTVAGTFREPLLIAGTTLFYGSLLGCADYFGRRVREQAALSWRDAIIIGLAQGLAVVPGTSRSGITMTAALFLGLNRRAAVHFSFLLSIPAILLAAAWETLHMLTGPDLVPWRTMAIVTTASAVTAYIAIHYFVKFIDRTGMGPYVIYRLALGTGLLIFFW